MGTGSNDFDYYAFYENIRKQERWYKEHFKEIYHAKMNDPERRKSVAEGYAKYKATGDPRLKVFETWQKSYDNYIPINFFQIEQY